MASHRTLLLIQLIACSMMSGIIWIVQLAIYPLFAEVGEASFENYHQRYTFLVSFVIMPTLFIEAASCGACLLTGERKGQLLPASLLLIAGLSTAFIQVPQHHALTQAGVSALVAGNWIRTIAWTFRTVLLARLITSHSSKG